MKHLFTIITIFNIFCIFSQEAATVPTTNDQNRNITFTTPTRDTLWIINNETGRLIAQSWNFENLPKNEKIPIIIMVDRLPENRKEKNKGSE